MKRLTKAQMKKITGGEDGVNDSFEDAITCGAGCTRKQGNTTYYGTCSKKTVTIKNITTEYCSCSESGGTGC